MRPRALTRPPPATLLEVRRPRGKTLTHQRTRAVVWRSVSTMPVCQNLLIKKVIPGSHVLCSVYVAVSKQPRTEQMAGCSQQALDCRPSIALQSIVRRRIWKMLLEKYYMQTLRRVPHERGPPVHATSYTRLHPARHKYSLMRSAPPLKFTAS